MISEGSCDTKDWFCSFILVSVYISPHTNARSAIQKLTDLTTDTEQKHSDHSRGL